MWQLDHKKAEPRRIESFELWCWRRFLRVPWTVRRSNQSILKEISTEYSLEGLMLKLKLQYFGHLMWRTDSLEKTLMLGKIEGSVRRGWQRTRWLNGITDSMDMNLSKHPGDGEGQGNLVCYSSLARRESGMTEWLNNNMQSCGYLFCFTHFHSKVIFSVRTYTPFLSLCLHSDIFLLLY